MKVRVRGSGKSVTIDKKNFLAQGGEGTIYVVGDTVYKICDPGKMIPDGKFKELSVLTDPHIMRPLDIVDDDGGSPVGYTTKFVPDTYTLCQIFPKTFRVRNNITPDMMLALVRQMQDTIRSIHKHSICIVDLNELNFLTDQKLKEVFFIDVNSYSTKSYPATVIMDNIRDRHAKKTVDQRTGKEQPVFDEMTDWFSFGIISFMMFVGIHPFKGKYPGFTDPSKSMDECMKHNLSVLNPKVSYPKGATLSFDLIPDVYKQWYEAVFERGMRIAPPADLVAQITVVTAKVQQIKGSVTFVIDEQASFGEAIVRHEQHNAHEVVTTIHNVYIDRRPYSVPGPIEGMRFVATKGGRVVAAWIDGGSLRLYDVVNRLDVPMTLLSDRLTLCNGNLYVQSGANLMEVALNEMGNRIIPTATKVGDVMENATQFFDGCVIQNAFGAYFVSMFPRLGEHRQFALKALKGYKVVDAKYESHVLMIMAVNTTTGKYDRLVFRFRDTWVDFETRVVQDVQNVGINFTVRANGITACINEEEKLEVFRSIYDPTKKDNGLVNVFDDPAIEGDMNLSHRADNTLFFRGSKLYSITAGKKP